MLWCTTDALTRGHRRERPRRRHRVPWWRAGRHSYHLWTTGLLRRVPVPTIDDIKADFDLLETWEDRYRYVMELGRALPPYPEHLRDEAHKVRGCASQVWLADSATGAGPDAVLHFDGDSDSHLVRGLVAVLLAGVQDRSARDILAFDAQAALRDLGLAEHLTPQRSNGFASMVARVRASASAIAHR
jgi:cysteine desulfuration protein SufE